MGWLIVTEMVCSMWDRERWGYGLDVGDFKRGLMGIIMVGDWEGCMGKG